MLSRGWFGVDLARGLEFPAYRHRCGSAGGFLRKESIRMNVRYESFSGGAGIRSQYTAMVNLSMRIYNPKPETFDPNYKFPPVKRVD